MICAETAGRADCHDAKPIAAQPSWPHRDTAKPTVKRGGPSAAGIVTAPAIEYLQIDSREEIYLISDLHLDHTNIIRYSERPFLTTRDMNRTMVKNWNSTVGRNDTVFFLGDMAYGRHRQPIDYWLQQLSGNIWFIRGNHDKDAITKANVIPEHYGVRYKGRELLLAHYPCRPDGFDGWLIHGHTHNTDLELYPLVNQERKTANVSVELISYTPISLDYLVGLIDAGITRRTL